MSKFQGIGFYGRLATRLAALVLAALASAAGPAVEVHASCAPLPPDATNWWRGDSSATDDIGTVKPDSPYTPYSQYSGGYAAGKVGQAFDFTSGGAGTVYGAPSNLVPPGFTVEFWVRTPFESTHVVDGGYDPYNQTSWWIGNGSVLMACTGSGSSTPCLFGPSIFDNAFHHVAFTYDGTTHVLKLYVDGSLSAATALIPNTIDPESVLVWGQGTGVASQFHGQVDELTLYSRALDLSEVSAIFSAGSDGKCAVGCGDGAVNAPETCDPAAPGGACCNSHCNGFDTACQCGDGVLQAGETCDPNAAGGECCNSSCDGFDAACQCGDGVLQASELCDPTVPGGECCNATCDGPAADGTACDDGDTCTGGDTCSFGSCGKGMVPLCCGDGQYEWPEVCDPSIDPRFSCCNATCTGFLDAGAPCSDGNSCTLGDHCGGGGSLCVSTAWAPDSTTCDDGDDCTGGDHCYGEGHCMHSTLTCCGDGTVEAAETCDPSAGSGVCCKSTCDAFADAVACEDGDACTANDTCSSGTCVSGGPLDCDDADPCTHDSCDDGCINDPSPLPEDQCVLGLKTSLKIKAGDQGSLKWMLKGGEALALADLGDPVADTDYALCIYDSAGSSPALWQSLSLPAGSSWSATKKGFAYEAHRPEGSSTLDLRPGDAGRSQIKFGLKDAELLGRGTTTFFDSDPSVIVQLVGPPGFCASTTFTPEDSSANKADVFSAKTH